MTIKDLSKYHKIKEEIKQLQDSIDELEATIIGSSKFSNVTFDKGKVSNPTEKLGINLASLNEKLNKKMNDLIEEQTKIEDFLESVEDNSIRIIIRSRFINEETWETIGMKLNYDRTTPYHQLKKYLRDRNESEKYKF